MVVSRFRTVCFAAWFALLWSGTAASSATITGFSPDRGTAGTEVTITGSALQTASVVYFGATDAPGQIVSVSATALRVRVPPNALTGPISVFSTSFPPVTSSRWFIAAPRVTEFSPLTGGAGTLVTITGDNFGTTSVGGLGNVTRVAFNGQAANFQVVAINQLIAAVPNGASSGPITLSNEAGDFTTLLSFHVPAQLAGFNPPKAAPGEAVDLRGQNLGSVQRVDIGLVSAAFTVGSATNVLVLVPTNAVDGRIQVTTPAGLATTSSNLVVLPRIIQFTPAMGPVGTSVVLEGGGFHGATEVLFGSTKATFTLRSSTRLETTVPSGAGTGPIKVTTPNGSFTTAMDFFLPPQITTFTPTTAARGDTVTIDGRNFTGTVRVAFNGAEAPFTVVSDTRLTATVPPLATSGRITVETPGGTAESSGTFTVRPILDGFAPSHGLVGSIVNLEGAGLTNLAWVRLGDLDTSFTVINATQVRVIVPLAAYSGPIRVGSSAGLEATAPGNFFVDGATPELTQMTPTTGASGTAVTLTGKGLRTASRVEFNGTQANFTVISGTEIQTTVPAGAATGKVAVTTLDGIAVSAADFVIPVAPVSLSVERGQGEIVFRWPASAADYRLESSLLVGAGAQWQAVAGTPVSSGGMLRQSVPASTSGTRYFRLKK